MSLCTRVIGWLRWHARARCSGTPLGGSGLLSMSHFYGMRKLCVALWSSAPLDCVALGVTCAALPHQVNNICVETGNVCEAMMTTARATCTQACAAGGMLCDGSWDDLDKCTRKAGPSNCENPFYTQICRCMRGDAPSISSCCTQRAHRMPMLLGSATCRNLRSHP